MAKTVARKKTTKGKVTKKSAMPSRPSAPELREMELKIVPKPRKDKDLQDNLRKAENALARAIETYKVQSEHKSNVGLDFAPFWDRLASLEAIYNEKGFLKSKRDMAYDWVGFTAEVKQVEEDLYQAVLEPLKEKFGRMVWNSNPMLTQEEADELISEADEKDHAKGKIWGWSNALRKLRAKGCVDPDEQPRGGRQSGGSRRRG